MKTLWIALLLASTLAGCANIKGSVTATLGPAGAPKSGEAFFVYVNPTMPSGEAIRRMIANKLGRLGFPESQDAAGADFWVMAYGSSSYSHTDSSAVVLPGSATSTISGSTVTTKFNPATVVDTSTSVYSKAVLVRMVRPVNGQPAEKRLMWEGTVQEAGWCPNIFVTAPNIVALMFKGFPAERFNATEAIGAGDAEVQALRSLFPTDSNWSCR